MPRNRSEKDTPRLKALRVYRDVVYKTIAHSRYADDVGRRAHLRRRELWDELKVVSLPDWEAMAFKLNDFRIAYCDEQLNHGRGPDAAQSK